MGYPRLKPVLLLAMLSVAGLASAAGKCDRVIATGAADNPPFLWRDPQHPERLIGANADLLRQITDAVDLKLEILYTGDAEKALDEVRSGRVDILAGVPLSIERLGEMDFVHPAVAELETLPWVRRDHIWLYGSREDLVGRAGAYVSGTRFGRAFDAFARDSLRMQSVSNLTQALQSVLVGESDYVLHERYSAIVQADTLGLLDDLQPLDPPVLSHGLHLAVSHDSACNDAWLRGQLALKMTQLRAAGVPHALLMKNIDLWKSQQLAPASTGQD